MTLHRQLAVYSAGSRNGHQLHLDLLAEIARLMSDDDIRNKLASETDPSAIHALLTTSDSREPC